MLRPDELRYACDNAQRRHAALVDLILSNDRMALGLMQLFIAIASASISGAAAIYFGLAGTPAPRWLAFVLLSLGIPAAVGGALCFVAMWPSAINLPGQDPAFWQWAMRLDVTSETAFGNLLDRLAAGHARNEAFNRRAARCMRAAKWCGVAGPALAILTFAAGALLLR